MDCIQSTKGIEGHRKKFKNLKLIQCEIVPFSGSEEEIEQVLSIANTEYSKIGLGREIYSTNILYPNGVFIAKEEDKVLGFVRYQIANEEMGNILISVDYENIKKGLSDALIQECIKEAGESNLRQISATVYEDNFLARYLFKRNEFTLLPYLFQGYKMYNAVKVINK